MKIVLTGAIAGAAIAALATGAQAANRTCQWTGLDWACGDGNVFTEHYTRAAGPNVQITPILTIDQARAARVTDPTRPHSHPAGLY